MPPVTSGIVRNVRRKVQPIVNSVPLLASLQHADSHSGQLLPAVPALVPHRPTGSQLEQRLVTVAEQSLASCHKAANIINTGLRNVTLHIDMHADHDVHPSVLIAALAI